MYKFWRRAEDIWNNSRCISWTLALIGLGGVFWTIFKPQSPGVSIGLLALAGGIMSVRHKMHPAEKTAWVAMLIAFAILEVVAINRSSSDNIRNQTAQNEQFKAIAKGLSDSYALSQKQFDATMDKTASVLTKTEVAALAARQAAHTSREGIDTLTGGDSVCFIRDFTPTISSHFAKFNSGYAQLIKLGRYPLYGVRAEFSSYFNVIMSHVSIDLIGMGAGEGVVELTIPPGLLMGSGPTIGDVDRFDLAVDYIGRNGTWHQVIHGFVLPTGKILPSGGTEFRY